MFDKSAFGSLKHQKAILFVRLNSCRTIQTQLICVYWRNFCQQKRSQKTLLVCRRVPQTAKKELHQKTF